MPEATQRGDSRHPSRPGRLARNVPDPMTGADRPQVRPAGQPAHSRQPVSAGSSPASGSRESFEVRFWKIRVYKGKRGRTYAVRWTVAGQEFHQTYGTSALADCRLAELRTFARNGVAFDVVSGLPVQEIRQTQAEAAKSSEVTWYDHAVRYVARRWDGL